MSQKAKRSKWFNFLRFQSSYSLIMYSLEPSFLDSWMRILCRKTPLLPPKIRNPDCSIGLGENYISKSLRPNDRAFPSPSPRMGRPHVQPRNRPMERVGWQRGRGRRGKAWSWPDTVQEVRGRSLGRLGSGRPIWVQCLGFQMTRCLGLWEKRLRSIVGMNKFVKAEVSQREMGKFDGWNSGVEGDERRYLFSMGFVTC